MRSVFVLIERRGEACILWPFEVKTGNKDYGRQRPRIGGNKRRNITIHRYVCELAHGPAPHGRPHAAHLCNVKRCINPDHLRWSSNSENMLDRRITQLTPLQISRLWMDPDNEINRRLDCYPANLLPGAS